MVLGLPSATVSRGSLKTQGTYYQGSLHQELFEAIGRRTVIVNSRLISVEELIFFVGVTGRFECHLR